MKPHRYLDRDHAIIEIARGRRVLHLGCVGHNDCTPEQRVQLAKQSLHWELSEAANTIGVDHSADVVAEYKRLNFFDNIVVGDVQRLEEAPIDEIFDVVVAGDIIEHLSNPGDLLDGIKRFCNQETLVIITTPYAFGLPNYVRFVLGRFRDGPEHVMTFNTCNIVNLLSRHGYAIDRIDTCHQAHAKRRGMGFTVARAFLRVAPKYGGTLFVVARAVL